MTSTEMGAMKLIGLGNYVTPKGSLNSSKCAKQSQG